MSGHAPPPARDWWGRLGALGVLTALVVYPVGGFMVLPDLPVWVKGAWVAVLAGAWLAPRPSLLLFLAGAPLLPTLPSVMRWPTVSLPEVWLHALLIPLLARRLVRPSGARVPSAAVLLALVATGSLLVALYPLHLAFESLPELASAVHGYARHDLLTSISQRHVYSSLLAWLVLVEGLALLWLVLALYRGATERDLRVLATAMSTGAAGVAAYGLYQRATGDHLLPFWRQVDPFLVRINATFTDVNALGSYLVSMVPLVAALAVLARRDESRWAWGGVVAACLLSMVFTGSRAAWGALLFAGLVATVVVLRTERAEWAGLRRVVSRALPFALAAGLAAVVVLTALGTARNTRPENVRSYTDTLLYTFNLRLPLADRLKGRTELWNAAGRMVLDRPLTGIGIGRYYKDVSAYAPDTAELIRPQENAHNYFLQVAAELGLPGLLLLMSLVTVPLGAALRLVRQPTAAPATRIIIGAAATGLLAHLLTWLTGHPLLIRDGQISFWPLVGLVLLGAPPLAVADRRVAWPRWAVATAACAVMVSVPFRAAAEVARVDLSRTPVGVYDVERDAEGRSFRWTGERVVIYVPSTARNFTLEVRALAPFPQTVDVRSDGTLVDRLSFTDHSWRTFRYQLRPAAVTRRFHRFELHVSPTWVPASRDDRTLGIVLGDWSWE